MVSVCVEVVGVWSVCVLRWSVCGQCVWSVCVEVVSVWLVCVEVVSVC